jgi:hypothetical protein
MLSATTVDRTRPGRANLNCCRSIGPFVTARRTRPWSASGGHPANGPAAERETRSWVEGGDRAPVRLDPTPPAAGEQEDLPDTART